MIYFPGRSLFIHVPRTSGVSLVAAVCRHLQDFEDETPVIINGGQIGKLQRHSRAADLAGLIDDWHRIEKFAVMRNPWRICESTYRYFHRKVAEARGRASWQTLATMPQDWIELKNLPFPEFVAHHFDYLQGGFWQHWCCDNEGGDTGVRAVLFEHLNSPNIWCDVCRLLRIPEDLQRPVENAGAGAPIEWTAESIRFVRDRCSNDFARFDYPESP